MFFIFILIAFCRLFRFIQQVCKSIQVQVWKYQVWNCYRYSYVESEFEVENILL